ncbi:integral membrane [Trichoderma cornu-damae]|uniref:Integral membrane n=1 Tax=Trichoderma cornu-damae TaxID=654480 RepID=A0A9P8QKJ7_9HYPO|nr:integral membrane [Trichoderma cornu-damae]
MATNRAPPSEQEMKKRIITHMNTQHTRELSHYLRHYVGLSPRAAASSPAIQDMNLSSMTIKTSNGTYNVPLSPPLESWAEARPRVIAMDETAREALGISDIYITEYSMPQGFDYVPLVGVVFYFVCATGLPWIVPGSVPWEVLKAVFPGGPEWFRWTVKTIFWPVVGIHLVEALLLDRRRLQKHGVARWSWVWWAWTSAIFFEGLTTWRRLDRVVSEKRAEKEAKKH